jgi:hypothetical protein
MDETLHNNCLHSISSFGITGIVVYFWSDVVGANSNMHSFTVVGEIVGGMLSVTSESIASSHGS